MPNRESQIERVPVGTLKHIEGFSKKRVAWLLDKVKTEGRWTKPLALDRAHHLVLDGQHRMEVAKALSLKWVPAVLYDYSQVEMWSLRKNHEFDWQLVTERALVGDIYPYKTVKHRFPQELPTLDYPLGDLLK